MCEHRINLTKAKLKTHENINTNKCTCTWSYQPQSLSFSKAFFIIIEFQYITLYFDDYVFYYQIKITINFLYKRGPKIKPQISYSSIEKS